MYSPALVSLWHQSNQFSLYRSSSNGAIYKSTTAKDHITIDVTQSQNRFTKKCSNTCWIKFQFTWSKLPNYFWQYIRFSFSYEIWFVTAILITFFKLSDKNFGCKVRRLIYNIIWLWIAQFNFDAMQACTLHAFYIFKQSLKFNAANIKYNHTTYNIERRCY